MKLEVDGVHKLENRDIARYINKKIGRLDKYLPRHARKSAHAQVKVREEKVKDKKECMCEVVLILPNETITAKESTMNMFAAVDIVEEKIKMQVKKYKEKNSPARGSRLRNALRKFSRD